MDELLMDVIDTQENLNKRISEYKINLNKKLSKTNLEQIKKISKKFTILYKEF